MKKINRYKQYNQDAANGNGSDHGKSEVAQAADPKAAHFNEMNGTVHQTEELFKKWENGVNKGVDLGVITTDQKATFDSELAKAKEIFTKAIADIAAAKDAAGVK